MPIYDDPNRQSVEGADYAIWYASQRSVSLWYYRVPQTLPVWHRCLVVLWP